MYKGTHFKKWFGYNRRERRSTSILLFVLLIICLSRYLIPANSVEIKNLSNELIEYKPVEASYSSPVANNINVRSRENQTKQKAQITLLNLNTCDSIMLEKLPGIGVVLSARIIKYRNLLGGYSDKIQLNEVYGLSAETYTLIESRVFADSSEVIKININKALYRDLIRHPYFEAEEVASVIKYRELIGRVGNLQELIDNKILTSDKAKKISPYLSFE